MSSDRTEVEKLADDFAAYEAIHHHSRDDYNQGQRDAWDRAETALRAAIEADHAAGRLEQPGPSWRTMKARAETAEAKVEQLTRAGVNHLARIGRAERELEELRAERDRQDDEIERLKDLADQRIDDLANAQTERDQLKGEVARLHTWQGLLELLDQHWPADIFPTRKDDPGRDTGPRLIAALRRTNQAENTLQRIGALPSYTTHDDTTGQTIGPYVLLADLRRALGVGHPQPGDHSQEAQ